MKKSPEIKIETIYRLTSLFNKKKWEIETDEIYKVSCFDRFCEMLKYLDSNQQELVFELTSEFLRVNFGEYIDLLLKAIHKIQTDKLKDINIIYILPLLKPKDIDSSIKSSPFVARLFMSPYFKYKQIFANKEIRVIDKPSLLPMSFNEKNELLFIVDDFVGSGNTAKEAIDYLFSLRSIPKNCISIISIVALNSGIQAINNLGFEFYYSINLGKGITDYYDVNLIQNKLKIMQDIERMIRVKGKFQLGYEKSEALVTLVRTPNNTFPIYWLQGLRSNGDNVVAPFPRY